MANAGDEEFLDGLAAAYGVKIKKQPCIRVTTPDLGEHMGISASDYENWTKERVELSGKQIYVVYQRNREERNLLGIDYGALYWKCEEESLDNEPCRAYRRGGI